MSESSMMSDIVGWWFCWSRVVLCWLLDVCPFLCADPESIFLNCPKKDINIMFLFGLIRAELAQFFFCKMHKY